MYKMEHGIRKVIPKKAKTRYSVAVENTVVSKDMLPDARHIASHMHSQLQIEELDVIPPERTISA